MMTQEKRKQISNVLVGLFLLFTIIGFADAAYLTAEHVRGGIPPCTVLHGCEQVLTSSYATVGAVPVAAFGMVYYTTLIILMVAYLDTGIRKYIHAASWLTIGGLLASLYLVSVMAFILKAFCQYCLVSAGTSVSLFVVAFVIMRRD